MARGAKSDPWVTTEQVAEAAGISPATVRRWGRLGVLPPQQVVFMGRRGRQSRWPLHTPEQARWVLELLERGRTFDEIRVMLAAGEFRPSSSGEATDSDDNEPIA